MNKMLGAILAGLMALGLFGCEYSPPYETSAVDRAIARADQEFRVCGGDEVYAREVCLESEAYEQCTGDDCGSILHSCVIKRCGGDKRGMTAAEFLREFDKELRKQLSQ